jgi:hypothetical protein
MSDDGGRITEQGIHLRLGLPRKLVIIEFDICHLTSVI